MQNVAKKTKLGYCSQLLRITHKFGWCSETCRPKWFSRCVPRT